MGISQSMSVSFSCVSTCNEVMNDLAKRGWEKMLDISYCGIDESCASLHLLLGLFATIESLSLYFCFFYTHSLILVEFMLSIKRWKDYKSKELKGETNPA